MLAYSNDFSCNILRQQPGSPADTTSLDAAATDRILRALCRIFAGNARGSGVMFDGDAYSYHVLTNAHVVGRTRNRVSLFRIFLLHCCGELPDSSRSESVKKSE